MFLAISGGVINAQYTDFIMQFQQQNPDAPQRLLPKQQAPINRNALMLELGHLQSLLLQDFVKTFNNLI
jgi:hypothetical protein